MESLRRTWSRCWADWGLRKRGGVLFWCKARPEPQGGALNEGSVESFRAQATFKILAAQRKYLAQITSAPHPK